MVESIILDTDIYLERLTKLLESAAPKELYQTIVDAPFNNKAYSTGLGLGIVVLLLVNKQRGEIDRVALARTDMAQGTVDMSSKPFKDIKIPLSDRMNYIAIAIRQQHYMITDDWQYLFVPALSAEEARFNQAGGGMACSVIYPLSGFGDGGAVIFSYFESMSRISKKHHAFMQRYAALVQKTIRKASQ